MLRSRSRNSSEPDAANWEQRWFLPRSTSRGWLVGFLVSVNVPWITVIIWKWPEFMCLQLDTQCGDPEIWGEPLRNGASGEG